MFSDCLNRRLCSQAFFALVFAAAAGFAVAGCGTINTAEPGTVADDDDNGTAGDDDAATADDDSTGDDDASGAPQNGDDDDNDTAGGNPQGDDDDDSADDDSADDDGGDPNVGDDTNPIADDDDAGGDDTKCAAPPVCPDGTAADCAISDGPEACPTDCTCGGVPVDDDDIVPPGDDDAGCVCAEIYHPVCGADGHTYGNECEAGCANVKIAHDGECKGEPPPPDGKYCMSTQDCGRGEVCSTERGDCLTPPSDCDPNGGPCGGAAVCYGVCELAPDGGQFCGGIAGIQCPPGFTCELDGSFPDAGGTCVADPGNGGGCMSDNECKAGYHCSTSDGDCGPAPGCDPSQGCLGPPVCYGSCVPDDGGCMCPMVYAPVCGADGKTYGNDCEAQCAGVAIDHPGECTSSGGNTCRRNRDCAQGQACVNGVCVDQTDTCACADIYDPVCGGDGKQYGNQCEAKCAGTFPAYYGLCECQIQCFMYDPVCADDGRTYGCGATEAECNGHKVVHDGECKDNTTCQPVSCTLACPNGFARDPNGCDVCACAQACKSDADCGFGGKCDANGQCMSFFP